MAVPLQDASFGFAGPPPASTGQPASCTTMYSLKQQCAIVIDVAATQPAHLLTLPTAPPLGGAAGPGSTPGTLLLAGQDRTIYQYVVTPTAVTADGSFTVPGEGVLVEGFSPDGRQVLYLQRGGPWSPPPTVGTAPTANTPGEAGIELRVGTITGRVAPTRLVLASAYVHDVSW